METYKITIPVTITVMTSDPKRVGIDFFNEFIMKRTKDFSGGYGDTIPDATYGEITSVEVGEDGKPVKVVEETDEA
jgi:hypothetical protein